MEDSIEENLPYPYVFYPNETWVGQKHHFVYFAETPYSQQYLCGCMRAAVVGYDYLLNKLQQQNPKFESVQPIYIDGLCHRCNLRVPMRSYYIHEPSLFDGCFHNYIVAQHLAYAMLPERGPSMNGPGRWTRSVVNKVRADFGFKHVGSTGVSERVLFLIVRDIFSFCDVTFHAYLPELKGLELDIYIPEKKLAFEYQGQQHYKPVKHWGGDLALEELKKRDIKKKRLCNKSGITLIKVKYNHRINHGMVFDLLEKYQIVKEL
ncbi:MAG: hypothetical protein COA63_010855 [Methylophaga sp.]|nr:hypothetical protein [Methylophaga sp.]